MIFYELPGFQYFSLNKFWRIQTCNIFPKVGILITVFFIVTKIMHSTSKIIYFTKGK